MERFSLYCVGEERGVTTGRPGISLRVAAVLIAFVALSLGTAAAHPDLEFVRGALEGLLAEHPDDPELLLRQGRLREMARDWDGALVAFAHAQEHGADPTAVAAARGRVFLAAGFPRMAMFEYDRALAQRPDAYELLFERGRVQLELGRPDAADEDFARAIANMKLPRPEQVIVRRDALLARGKREEAVRALDEGIARLGPIASLELPAIDIEVDLGHYNGALRRLDTLLQQTPANAAWIARRAEILKRAGRATDARAEFARALRQIETKPAQRQNTATKELAERLRAELASLDTERGENR